MEWIDHVGKPRAYRLRSGPPHYSQTDTRTNLHERVFVEARHRTPAKNKYKLVFFSFWKTFNLFLFNHGNTMNNRNNKNYIQVRGPPSDDYKYRIKPKARRRHRPFLVGARQKLL